MAEDNEHANLGERVKINVGGTVFETSIFTLTRLDNTMLYTMVANRWRNQEELFVDRSPTHFSKMLDYLRDGENFALPTETDAREALRKEAEFYNIPDLAKMCVFDVDVFKVGDWVQWRDEVIEEYWKYLVRYQIRSNKPGRDHLRCMACGYFAYGYVGPTGTTMTEQQKSGLPIIYEDWLLLKHHMRTMKGIVSEVYGLCCFVKWSPTWIFHLPKSALRVSR